MEIFGIHICMVEVNAVMQIIPALSSEIRMAAVQAAIAFNRWFN